MQKLEIQYFEGTIKDVSGRLIPDNALQDSLNIIFDNKKIKNRYGLQQLAQELPSEVLAIDIYKQLYSDTAYVVAFTSSDILYLDSKSTWKYITRTFNYGTVGIPNGSKTITLTTPSTAPTLYTNTITAGISLSWQITVQNAVTGVKVGMLISGTGIQSECYVAKVDYTNKIIYLSKPLSSTASGTVTTQWRFRNSRWLSDSVYQIAFGYTDQNSVPSNEWRTIKNFSTDLVCTLVDTYTGTTLTASTYVIRVCYNADIDNKWNICYPYDDSMQGGGDKALLCTNGVDHVQRWQGIQNGQLTYCEDVFAYPNICKQVAFYGTIGSEHILCSNVYDTAMQSWNVTAIECSDAGEISWEDGATYPLFDSSSQIKGIESLMTKIVIYKEKSISIAQTTYSSDVSNPFDIQQDIIRTIGAISIETVKDTGKFHIFFTGERIVIFDGFNHSFVDDGVYKYINRIMNSNYSSRSFAFLITELKLYCLAIPAFGSNKPNFVVVYNYVEQNFTFWNFSNDDYASLLPITCKGEYIVSFSPTWADIITTGLTGTAASSSTITLAGTASKPIAVGMRVVPTGYSGSNLYIKSITDSTHIVVGTSSDETKTDQSYITATAITLTAGTVLVIGFTAAQSNSRWSDLISEDANSRHIIGGEDGKIYELSKYNAYDLFSGVQEGISSSFETKDFEYNKGLTFLMQEITLRVSLLEMSDVAFYPGSLDIFASVDYGFNWSPVATLLLDGTETFMEKKIALHMRGKAIRFKIQTEMPFQFENCIFGFNIQGKSFKYDR